MVLHRPRLILAALLTGVLLLYAVPSVDARPSCGLIIDFGVSPDGRYLSVSRNCGQIDVWDLGRLLDPVQPVDVLLGHVSKRNTSTENPQVLPEAGFLAATERHGGDDPPSSFWHCDYREMVRCVARPNGAGEIRQLLYLPGGTRALVVGRSAIRIERSDTGEVTATRPVTGEWRHLAFDPEHGRAAFLITGGGTQRVAVLDLTDLSVVHETELASGSVRAMAFSADGAHLAVGHGLDAVEASDGRNRVALLPLPPKPGPNTATLGFESISIVPGSRREPLWYAAERTGDGNASCLDLFPASPNGTPDRSAARCLRRNLHGVGDPLRIGDLLYVAADHGVAIGLSNREEPVVFDLATGSPLFDLTVSDANYRLPLRPYAAWALHTPQNDGGDGPQAGSSDDTDPIPLRDALVLRPRVPETVPLFASQPSRRGIRSRFEDWLRVAIEDPASLDRFIRIMASTRESYLPLWTLMLERENRDRDSSVRRKLAALVAALSLLDGHNWEGGAGPRLGLGLLRELAAGDSVEGAAMDGKPPPLEAAVDAHLLYTESRLWAVLGRAFLFAHDTDSSRAAFEAALLRDPVNSLALDGLIWLSLGDEAETDRWLAVADERLKLDGLSLDPDRGVRAGFFSPADIAAVRGAVRQGVRLPDVRQRR